MGLVTDFTGDGCPILATMLLDFVPKKFVPCNCSIVFCFKFIFSGNIVLEHLLHVKFCINIRQSLSQEVLRFLSMLDKVNLTNDSPHHQSLLIPSSYVPSSTIPSRHHLQTGKHAALLSIKQDGPVHDTGTRERTMFAKSFWPPEEM